MPRTINKLLNIGFIVVGLYRVAVGRCYRWPAWMESNSDPYAYGDQKLIEKFDEALFYKPHYEDGLMRSFYPSYCIPKLRRVGGGNLHFRQFVHMVAMQACLDGSFLVEEDFRSWHTNEVSINNLALDIEKREFHLFLLSLPQHEYVSPQKSVLRYLEDLQVLYYTKTGVRGLVASDWCLSFKSRRLFDGILTMGFSFSGVPGKVWTETGSYVYKDSYRRAVLPCYWLKCSRLVRVQRIIRRPSNFIRRIFDYKIKRIFLVRRRLGPYVSRLLNEEALERCWDSENELRELYMFLMQLPFSQYRRPSFFVVKYCKDLLIQDYIKHGFHGQIQRIRV